MAEPESLLTQSAIKNKSSWIGAEIKYRENEWRSVFLGSELAELGSYCDELIASNECFDEHRIYPEKINHFGKLPLLTLRMKALMEDVVSGLGFAVISGVPVESWGYVKSCIAFVVLGKISGSLRVQNAKGHIMGHVCDLGLSSSDPNVRVYQTHERQTFHTDSCDVVALLCLRPALISGGDSSVVSSETIFNEMLHRRPDLLLELMKPIPTDRRGEVPEGMLPYFLIPVFNMFDGHLSAIYQRQYVDSSQRFPDAPRITPQLKEALDLFDTLADDIHLHVAMTLSPGDVQLVHNHNMLHDRSAFVDSEDPTKKRHLLRLWIAPPSERPLPEAFSERFGSVEVGNRGGLNLAVEPVAPFAPV